MQFQLSTLENLGFSEECKLPFSENVEFDSIVTDVGDKVEFDSKTAVVKPGMFE